MLKYGTNTPPICHYRRIDAVVKLSASVQHVAMLSVNSHRKQTRILPTKPSTPNHTQLRHWRPYNYQKFAETQNEKAKAQIGTNITVQ